MMPRYMITHSLLASWLYAMKNNPYSDSETEPEDPLEEFQKILNREPTETTEAMQNGIDFEDLVTSYVMNRPDQPDKNEPWSAPALNISDIVAGGQLQVKCGKTVEIGGLSIFLYGRLDALKAGTIYDIKFSKSYERGKYYDSTQHPMYFELVPEATTFTYLVSNGGESWSESYRRDETQSIIPVISEFLGWLQGAGMMELFKSRWMAR